MTATPTPDEATVTLETILRNDDLTRRPTRPPNFEVENGALVGLGQAITDAPRTVLRRLTEIIMEMLDADSAGVSVPQADHGNDDLVWAAIAGQWNPYVGRGTLRNFGPCGDVLDRNAPLLFSHPERRYGYLAPITPLAQECLMVPVHVRGRAVGTIWAIMHDGRRPFDQEDLRELSSVARLASSAFKTWTAPDDAAVTVEERTDAVRAARGAATAGQRPNITVNQIEPDCETDDGRMMRIAVNRLPTDGANRQRQGASTVVGDTTGHQRMEADLRESEIRYRRLFQTAKDGILLLDAVTGKIIDANAFMSGLLGLDLSDILGKELWEIGLFEDIAKNKSAFEQLQEHGYIRYDHLPVQKPNGETTQVEFVSNVYKEGARLVAQCNVRDITVRAKMEEQIKQQTEALADQARRKDEFLAMLSHELRNPLAPIRSATHILRLQEHGTENLIQQQAREVIERQVATLTRLVSDLLEVSRALTGQVRLSLETVDLNQVLQHALETAKPLMDQRGHTLAINLNTEPVWALADPTRMEEVLVNLLGNAAKYTDRGGRIEVACERGVADAVLRVRDNGAGIDRGLLPHIFDLFTQANRTLDRAQGGLGIGLSLAHRLVALHGGTIEGHSDGAGLGSEFIVRIKLARAPGVTAPTPASEPARPQGLRVLVVDDNVDACSMLANLMQLRGYGVQTAHTGSTALATALSWKPDVVLLDIGLPEIDGYEVARRLRADPSTRNMRLVAITGYGTDKDRQLGSEAGFDAQLLKPADLEKIESLLEAWARVPTGR